MITRKWTYIYLGPPDGVENDSNLLFDSKDEAQKAADNSNWNYTNVFEVYVVPTEYYTVEEKGGAGDGE